MKTPNSADSKAALGALAIVAMAAAITVAFEVHAHYTLSEDQCRARDEVTRNYLRDEMVRRVEASRGLESSMMINNFHLRDSTASH